jgi:hypothetical protein
VRLVGLLSLLGCALLLAGCGAESPRQSGARVAVSDSLSATRYEVDRTRCTDDPSAWFIERETTVYVCAARLRDGGCDWYQATLKNAGWDVVLDEKNAGCVLPF